MRKSLIALCAIVPLAGCGEGDDTSYSDVTTGTYDCSHEPRLRISTTNASLTFNGECERVTIKGDRNAAKVASAKTFVINGSDNDAEIGSADFISVEGSNNKARYGKGITKDSPNVVTNGNGNSVGPIN